jgi:hypothetical protein
MTGQEEKPDPKTTFLEGMTHASEYLFHHFAHGTEILGKLEASEVLALGEVSMYSTAAMIAAVKGDWEKAAEHAGNMANAATNSLSGGILGVLEATADAAALAHHLQGHNAPTFEHAMNTGFKAIGEHIGDKVADAREVTQLWLDKVTNGHDKEDHRGAVPPVTHIYENANIREILNGSKSAPNSGAGDQKQHQAHGHANDRTTTSGSAGHHITHTNIHGHSSGAAPVDSAHSFSANHMELHNGPAAPVDPAHSFSANHMELHNAPAAPVDPAHSFSANHMELHNGPAAPVDPAHSVPVNHVDGNSSASRDPHHNGFHDLHNAVDHSGDVHH